MDIKYTKVNNVTPTSSKLSYTKEQEMKDILLIEEHIPHLPYNFAHILQIDLKIIEEREAKKDNLYHDLVVKELKINYLKYYSDNLNYDVIQAFQQMQNDEI